MIEAYLSQKDLVQNVLTMGDLKDMVESGRTLNIMMGQTFDSGQPVDLLKYGLFIMNLSDLLRENGSPVISRWLIADHFITDINQDLEIIEAKDQINKRVDYLQKMNHVYGGDIEIVFSSELSQRHKYKYNVELLLSEAERNKRFKEQVLNAVPEDRRSSPNALQYPFEELATIQSMSTDIKVGPPYEANYDGPAREIAQTIGFNRYVAIHLTRGFPFGSPEIQQDILKEIENFGILPYKKGSKGLGKYRIDPISDSAEDVQRLIESTNDPRPILDLLIISELAHQRLERLAPLGIEQILKKVYNTATEDLNLKALQEIVFKSYVNYIHIPLR